MEYNRDYIDLNYTLISCFLFSADRGYLDISYSIVETKIEIQVVLLEGFSLSREKKADVQQRLSSFDVSFSELCLTKEQFNENKSEWQPRDYEWLDNVLFSKAETQ